MCFEQARCGSIRHDPTMTTSRADRRRDRHPRAVRLFGADAEAALDVMELTDLAWHDCYSDVASPDAVVDDILLCSEGQVSLLARAARTAVADYRDLRLQADGIRTAGTSS